MKLTELQIRLNSLAIFRALLSDSVVSALSDYLNSREGETVVAVSKYAAFVSSLYSTEKRTLAGYIQHIVNNDENAYIRMIGQGKQPWPEMQTQVEQELLVLQAIADLTPEALREGLDWDGFLPLFANKQLNIVDSYHERCANIHRLGFGLHAKHIMFYIGEGNRIVPVINPDQTRLSSLIDYKREQRIVR